MNRRFLLLCMLASLPLSARITQAQGCRTLTASTIAEVRSVAAAEISGLVRDRDNNGWWAINDSGNPSELLGLSPNGELHTVATVAARNRDWEAMAAFRHRRTPYLLIADTGDNLLDQKHYRLIYLQQPMPAQKQPLIPLTEQRFNYPVGPRNTEAVAVSAVEGLVYLLPRNPQKSNGQASEIELFTLPLATALSDNTDAASKRSTQPADVAQARGKMSLPLSAADKFLQSLSGIDMVQATDISISADNRYFWLLSYRYVFVWERENPAHPWYEILRKNRPQSMTHNLKQAEAITAGEGCEAFVTSEKRPAPILRITTRQ